MNIKRIVQGVLLTIPILLGSAYAQTDRAGEIIDWSVVSGGAELSSSPSYFLSGTVGQVAVGSVKSANHAALQGFLQDFGTFFVCNCKPGEVTEDDYINVLDIIAIVDYKFRGGPAPEPYALCNGDPNCDCIVNVLDIIRLVDYKFREGDEPCSCHDWVEACGLPVVK